MRPLIERRALPHLLGGQRRGPAPDAGHQPSLLDLLHEGFYAVFMLKNGATPPDEATFLDKIRQFLAEFDTKARKLQAHGDDIEAAKYAYCAALDEVILSSTFPIRPTWERRPLQLALFGEQLAGQHFFDRLEALRGKGGVRVQALQVFHMCLLMGFRGRFALDDSDKLNNMAARLGDEIAHIKGKSRGFAPQAERPDQIVNKLRSDLPLWALASVFALIGLGSYVGLNSSLNRTTQTSMAAYADLVKLAPQPANVTITLP
ncbi:type IVB secretion system protein IcmH/DotU [Rugamonas sp. CCM 8940]|uniref:type IVB secretion system protein IcmH/DotU n=1 Tax=Rugamonas sp. CCM 8940 TaxID=2765359 RepID=UPI0018F5E6AB|nr:type IVB secretion system protein IcmH/DotU [Rugamonas sp. CCM 8940]MBJ7310791.1 type IVB secretion system protein IcmH/DotU [Rugamonas sp. CCM 8940]